MLKRQLFVTLVLIALAAACSRTPTATPPPAATVTPISVPTMDPTPTMTSAATIASPNGYRPLQTGDVVQSATIDYEYVLPSIEQPVVDIAFGRRLLQLVRVKPELQAGLVAYIQEIRRDVSTVNAFDEADSNQTEPKPLAIDKTKPVEIAFIPLIEGQQKWSVTESDQNEIRNAYQLVRRRDGGLRFIDAYDEIALHSFLDILALRGGGAGLVFSARLAQLRTILTDPTYQRGANVMSAHPPDATKYDPRVFKVDATKQGLEMNVDWALIGVPVPSPGRVAP